MRSEDLLPRSDHGAGGVILQTPRLFPSVGTDRFPVPSLIFLGSVFLVRQPAVIVPFTEDTSFSCLPDQVIKRLPVGRLVPPFVKSRVPGPDPPVKRRE